MCTKSKPQSIRDYSELNGPATDSPVNQLLKLEREVENNIHFMDKHFGTLGRSEYADYKNYLIGLQSGIRTAMRLLDV